MSRLKPQELDACLAELRAVTAMVELVKSTGVCHSTIRHDSTKLLARVLRRLDRVGDLPRAPRQKVVAKG